MRIPALLVLLALLLAAGCTSGTSGTASTPPAPSTPGSSSPASSAGTSVPATTSATTPASTSPAPSTTVPAGPVRRVHVSAFPGDGSTVGVGMPIIATFDRKITDARAFAKGTTVTVDGKPAGGAWFFEYSDPASGHVMEAHYRPEQYWPAHAKIHVTFALKNVTAGTGLAFDGELTSLDYATGARNVSVVNDRRHTITVYSDGAKYGTFPVSLGARSTPTARGVKVIMEQGKVVRMRGPGYDECCVMYTQRLTYGGEYLHSAPWNLRNIGSYDSSNGCTNLRPDDAKQLFGFLRVGDVVQYPNANGPKMRLGDGYGDWNVAWPTWLTGGAVRTS